MKISKQHRTNNFIISNAKIILKNQYDNDETFLHTIIKCMLHDGIIYALHHSGMLNKIVFHGGTCLQRVYNSVRLSEDLYFCVVNYIQDDKDFFDFCLHFEDCIKSNFAKQYHIDTSDIFLQKPKKDLLSANKYETFSWKVSLLLNLGSAREVIKIDLENRMPCTSDIKLFKKLKYNEISFDEILLHVEKEEEILVNKFLALFLRKKIQYRDYFDFVFLYQKLNNLNFDILYKKLELRNSKELFFKQVHERKNIYADYKIIQNSLNIH